MAKQFPSLRAALSHAHLYGRPRGVGCPLGGRTHWQAGDDGPDEGEALVVRTITHDVLDGDPEAKASAYTWATSGGMAGHIPEYQRKVMRARLREAGVLRPPVRRVRTRKVVRDYHHPEDRMVTTAIDEE